MLRRLLLVRVELEIRLLISVNGFTNNIPYSFGRIPILLQHFVNFLTLKEQQLSVIGLLQILIALLTTDRDILTRPT